MKPTHLGRALVISLLAAMPALITQAQDALPPKQGSAKRPVRPGVSTPGVKRAMADITPVAVFPIEGTPDWQVITEDAVWVANAPRNAIHRLDPATNKVVAAVAVGRRPCSGLAAGFGSIWVPLCGDKALVRVDAKSNQVTATIPAGPAQSEGGIATGAGSVWLVTEPRGSLSRIDPAQNRVVAEIAVPAGSAACVFAGDAIWVTTPQSDLLTKVDPKTNRVVASIPVGPQPRFLTSGADSIWTLNQGDGTVSRVDERSGILSATIEAGIPGTGGEIAFGAGHIWATVFQIPISEIDPATNRVVRQWTGAGGDSIRVGHGSIWLSNLREQNLWRIDPASL